VVGEVGFADHEQSVDGAHQLVVHPQAAHGVVHRRVDTHGSLVGILAGDPLVHVEQIPVSFADNVDAQPFDGVGKIQVNAETGFSHTAALVAHGLRIARSYVARHQV